MSERANPNLFKNKFYFSLKKGFVPWITYKKNPYRKAFFFRYKWVRKYCKNRNVLDIPCGMGWGTSLLKKSRLIVGMDISSEAINEAKMIYGESAQFSIGNMTELGFIVNGFDMIVCLEGIEHISREDGISFIREAHRILRPNGQLFISSPSCSTGEHSGNKFHVYEYKPEELTELLSQYFNIIETMVREVDNLRIHFFRAVKKDIK